MIRDGKIRCVVSCRDANGEPTFFPCEVPCTDEEYAAGLHYDKAIGAADKNRYEGPGLVYDELDGPAWLFAHLFPEIVKSPRPADPPGIDFRS